MSSNPGYDVRGKDPEELVDAYHERGITGDAMRWEKGDIALGLLPKVSRGRPADDEALTLHKFAELVVESAPRMAEYRLCAKFYPRKHRTSNDISWSHFNAARRASKGSLERALEALKVAREHHMSVRSFEDYLSGKLGSAVVRVGLLPNVLQGLIPSWAEKVRVTLRLVDEAE